MTLKTLQELAAENALGALNQSETIELAAAMAHDAKARAEVAAFIDTAAAMAAAASPRVTPSEGLRGRVLAGIAGVQQERVETEAPEGYRFVMGGDDGWDRTAIPGFRTKPLSEGPHAGRKVMLISLDAGASVPDHDHEGTEEIYMLTGHLQTEGRLLGPGDFVRAEAGTHHYVATSPEGCVALLILGPAMAV